MGERRENAGLGLRRRDRVGELVVKRRYHDANNMMHTFLKEPIRRKKTHPGSRTDCQG
jgi:hypothetical protein